MHSDSSQEQERLRRLRDQQLAERDPRVKQREYERRAVQRVRKARQPFSMRRAWEDIPHVWRGLFYGLLLGVLALVTLPALWNSPWAFPCAGGMTLVFVAFGVVIGRAMDTRDELRDLTQ